MSIGEPAGAVNSASALREEMVTITRIENGFIVQKAFGGSGRLFASTLQEVGEIVARHFSA